MQSSWTKGPWEALNTDRCPVIVGVGSEHLADVNNYYHEHDRNLANAQLIAAAPDLYEALQLVIGSLAFDREDDTNKEVLRRIKAALAKAESRLTPNGD